MALNGVINVCKWVGTETRRWWCRLHSEHIQNKIPKQTHFIYLYLTSMWTNNNNNNNNSSSSRKKQNLFKRHTRDAKSSQYTYIYIYKWWTEICGTAAFNGVCWQISFGFVILLLQTNCIVFGSAILTAMSVAAIVWQFNVYLSTVLHLFLWYIHTFEN